MWSSIRAGAAGALVGLVLVGCAIAHPPPAPPRQTNLGLTVSGFGLSNGLRVVLVQDPRASEVQVTMRYQVGSADDPADQDGVAHFVEHLMFQQVLGGQSLFAHLEQIATLTNANTTWDATTYFERAQASHLDEMLSIEAVRLGFRCTTLSDSAFAREREVVINEIRQHDNSRALLTAINDGVYPVGHPYRRPIAGSAATVAAITRDQACAFADAHYGPKNAVLVVSGDLTPAQLETALKKFLARVAKHPVAAPAPADEVELAARRVDVPAPIDDPAFIIAWPLPSDPLLRAQVRAIAREIAVSVDGTLKGQVAQGVLGDGRAPMVFLAVFPKAGEKVDDELARAKQVIEGVPSAFSRIGSSEIGELRFDRVQQTAIYNQFAALEVGADRDIQLAADVLAGRSPNVALGAAFQGLREMTPEDASRIARERLSFDRAAIVMLKPSESTKRGHPVELAPAIHDLGQRRDPPDPADAHHASSFPLGARGLAGMTTRELPNGLRVVLLPVTSVPTVEVRLVFRSGTADEPIAKRGAALVAAHALTWDPRFLNDLLAFAAAGGTQQVDVGTDHTSFVARGVDMHLDFLLAGLRRWIREGEYDNDAGIVVDAMQAEAKRLDDDGALTDAWRAALYGPGHPYIAAGRLHYASAQLTPEDAVRFREAHYLPDNATLVIAGRFDAALADRWIDYLFADWTGHAEPRRAPPAVAQPASLASRQATAQVHLVIALPVAAGPRARQLVAAELLAEIAGDVRQQLGASYGLGAYLDESRLATNYMISGWVDDPRTSEAVELIRSRLDQLRSDAETAARAFVTARERVLTHLLSTTGSAETLAARVEHDVELERAPMSDVQTAQAVQQLTIDDMAASLVELDLARAVVMMRGPAAEIDQAFGVLGRQPTYVHVNPVEADDNEPIPGPAKATTPARRSKWDSLTVGDLADALTAPAPTSSLMLAVAPGYSVATFSHDDVSGVTVAGEIGSRFDVGTGIGLHASIGRFTGSYDLGVIGGGLKPTLGPLTVIPINVSAVIHVSAYDRIWGGILVGIDFDHVAEAMASWQTKLDVAVEGGVDILKRGPHNLSAYLRAESEIPDAGFLALTLGLAYRR